MSKEHEQSEQRVRKIRCPACGATADQAAGGLMHKPGIPECQTSQLEIVDV